MSVTYHNKYPRSLMDTIAKNFLNQSLNKFYKYSIFNGTHRGVCTIKGVSYDSLFNCFILNIQDVNTEKVFIVDRCNIYLKEIMNIG